LLFELRIDPDQSDILKKTPLNLSSTTPDVFAGLYSGPRSIVSRLLANNVRFDEPDAHARTPFLNFYKNRELVRAQEFLRLGANAD
jgi:hypothetical protein